MKLRKLLNGLEGFQVVGSKDIFITGITSNSKSVFHGNLFIAKKGRVHDGSKFIQEAIHRGAIAVAVEIFDPVFSFITQVIHPSIASIDCLLAANYYQNPSHELFMVAITGTNGKTTTSFIVKSLLEACIGSCGLIGTIENRIGKQIFPATHTTPDVTTNQKLLREMVMQGCTSAVMEVTSHALDQGRVNLIDYDAAVFTNLTPEHLDYHGCMDTYAHAKKKLFDSFGKKLSEKKNLKRAIVNHDSPWTPLLLKDCSVKTLTYGIDEPADLTASNICFEEQKTRAMISYLGQSIECQWPLIGRFNVYNCLAAIGVILSQNISLETIASHLTSISSVPGRLQPIKNDLKIQIYVDFAHKTDALISVLKTLKEMKSAQGQLIVVFGCGGDRDRTKRPKMAQACEEFADFSIVTSDNPRSEDPESICNEIAGGFSKREVYLIELKRKKAIETALEIAKPGDTVLIAGKGHEKTQISGIQTADFDDCSVAIKKCEELVLKGKYE